MAISRKPVRAVPIAGSVDVDALINKGGTAPAREAERTDVTAGNVSPIVLRLPTSLLAQVDALIKARPLRIPRHTWLVEAVYEKIRRESES
jgi:hypothetical protein